jgi:RNA polymerase sigma factor (sigma-70 family)
MSRGPLNPLLRRLCRLASPPQPGGLLDAQLLERWLALRDEAAFEVLVWRHGPVVLGACRRLLSNPADVEDAFQATFLVLVRKAGSIGRRDSVAGWLYRVAYRVALRAKARSTKRAARELAAAEEPAAPPADDAAWRDLRPVLDEEVNGLPDKYRAAFVLCYLQGRSNAEAAREIGCPVGTVLSRLAWARQRLRGRLTRRGVTLAAGTLAVLPRVAEAAPPEFVEATVQAGLAYSAGPAVAAGTVSAEVAALTEGVVRSMFVTNLKLAALAAAVLGILGAGAGATYGVLAEPAAAIRPDPAAAVADEPTNLVAIPSRRDGVLEVIGPANVVGIKVNLEGVEKPANLGIPVQKPAAREGVGEAAVQLHLRGEVVQRRWKAGDPVKKGDVLARLDDRLARSEVEIKEAKLVAAKADFDAAEKTREEAKARYDTQLRLRRQKGTSDEEVRGALVTWERYIADVVGKRAAVRVAEVELEQAKAVVAQHVITSPVSGTVKRVLKHAGEAVKALEPVMIIELAKDDE